MFCMKTVCVSFLMLLCFTINAQPLPDEVCLYQGNIQRVRNEPVYWYGLDLSHVRLVEGKRLNQKERIAHVECPAWVDFFREVYVELDLQKLLKNKMLVLRNEKFQFDRIDEIDTNQIVNYRDRDITLDTVKALIKAYNLAETTGVGYTLIVGNLNKEKECADAFTVFFDIASREPIWVCRVYDTPKGYGLKDYWGSAIHKCFLNFYTYFYKNKLFKS